MISAFDFKFFKERSPSRASRNGFCSLSFFVAGRLWRQMPNPYGLPDQRGHGQESGCGRDCGGAQK
jgi:hypothetical protein